MFVAVRPPEDVCVALGRLPLLEEPGVRCVPPEQWHVTLRFLGRADPDRVVDALGSVELPPATVLLGPAVVRLGRTVVVLPAAGLDALAAAVCGATTILGKPVDPRGFKGHLSLARLTDRARCASVGLRFSARFEVSEVELVSSVTDPAGAIHEVLHRFPCRAPSL